MKSLPGYVHWIATSPAARNDAEAVLRGHDLGEKPRARCAPYGRISVRTNYVLIDYENVPVKAITRLREEHFRVSVFLGAKNTKLSRELVIEMQALGNRGEYVELETSGQNALDFHVAFYLGRLAERDPEGFFHIISKDTGFDPLIAHLKAKKMHAARSASIDEMPCFNPKPLETANAGPRKSIASPSLAQLVQQAVEDLRKRKAAKPRTVKTLRSTLRAKFPKAISDPEIELILEALVEEKFAVIEGTKVTYAIPND